MPKEVQKTTWTEKIRDCGTDAKKLYTLINSLTNNNFMSKIKSIKDTLDSHPFYKPTRRDVPKLSRFLRITEDQVEKIIRCMPSKCCELDVMPPTILKQIIPSVITPITILSMNRYRRESLQANEK